MLMDFLVPLRHGGDALFQNSRKAEVIRITNTKPRTS